MKLRYLLFCMAVFPLQAQTLELGDEEIRETLILRKMEEEIGLFGGRDSRPRQATTQAPAASVLDPREFRAVLGTHSGERLTGTIRFARRTLDLISEGRAQRLGWQDIQSVTIEGWSLRVLSNRRQYMPYECTVRMKDGRTLRGILDPYDFLQLSVDINDSITVRQTYFSASADQTAGEIREESVPGDVVVSLEAASTQESSEKETAVSHE